MTSLSRTFHFSRFISLTHFTTYLISQLGRHNRNLYITATAAYLPLSRFCLLLPLPCIASHHAPLKAHDQPGCPVRVFRQKFKLEDANGSTHVRLKRCYACDQRHSTRNFTLLPVHTVNYVTTLKVTAAYLRKALGVIKAIVEANGTILFVNCRDQDEVATRRAATARCSFAPWQPTVPSNHQDEAATQRATTAWRSGLN
jgi:hypothetical protein